MTCRILLFITLCCSLTGCQSNLLQNALAGNSVTAAEDAAITTMSMTQSGGEEAAHVAAINEVLDASVEEIPTISAVGYAVVSSHPGRSENQRRLMAIRSARMAAMRDLAEQIHGLNVEGNTTVIDLMVPGPLCKIQSNGLNLESGWPIIFPMKKNKRNTIEKDRATKS